MASPLGRQPLCTAGRCAQILAAIAEAQTMTKLGELYGRAIADVIKGVLEEFGVDTSDEDVRAVVFRHIEHTRAASYNLGRDVDARRAGSRS